jgi:hypothetical protein
MAAGKLRSIFQGARKLVFHPLRPAHEELKQVMSGKSDEELCSVLETRSAYTDAAIQTVCEELNRRNPNTQPRAAPCATDEHRNEEIGQPGLLSRSGEWIREHGIVIFCVFCAIIFWQIWPITLAVFLLWAVFRLFEDEIGGCLVVLLEMGLELAGLVIAIVIALAVYHALFGR